MYGEKNGADKKRKFLFFKNSKPKKLIKWIDNSNEYYFFQKKLFNFIYLLKKDAVIDYINSITVEDFVEIFENIDWSNSNISDIALNYLEYVFHLLKEDESAKIITYLSDDIVILLIEQLKSSYLTKIIEYLENYEIINILNFLPHDSFLKLLNCTDNIDKKKIYEILKYNENFAGSMMSKDYFKFNENDLISQIVNHIKKDKTIDDKDQYYYVLNKKNQVLGFFTLKDLFFSNNNKKIKTIVKKCPVLINSWDDKEETILLFQKYNLLEVPVINENNELEGIIYYDEVSDAASEEIFEDFQKIAGIDPFKEPYLSAKTSKIVKSRMFWLSVLLISATLSQIVIQALQTIIGQNFASQFTAIGTNLVALFAIDALIPLISGAAGNAGTQSSTTIIRGLAMDQISVKDYWKVAKKELKIALTVGFGLAVINAIRMIIYDVIYNGVSHKQWHIFEFNWLIIIGIFFSLIITILISKTLGSTLPIILRKFKKDPSVMSSPLLTTLVDALCNGITYAICIAIFVIAFN